MPLRQRLEVRPIRYDCSIVNHPVQLRVKYVIAEMDENESTEVAIFSIRGCSHTHECGVDAHGWAQCEAVRKVDQGLPLK